jgi:hypothetical protein
MSIKILWNYTCKEKLKYTEKNLSQYDLFTINPTYNGLGMNPKILDERSVAYCTRHGSPLPTACEVCGINEGKYIRLVYATWMAIYESSVCLKADP